MTDRAETVLSAYADSLFEQLRAADRAVADAQVAREQVFLVYQQVIQKLHDASK